MVFVFLVILNECFWPSEDNINEMSFLNTVIVIFSISMAFLLGLALRPTLVVILVTFFAAVLFLINGLHIDDCLESCKHSLIDVVTFRETARSDNFILSYKLYVYFWCGTGAFLLLSIRYIRNRL